MQTTLTEICEYLNNHFVVSKTNGHFAISGGTISLPELQDGQYFRIVGSVFNQGVHRYPATDLIDEEFDGSIWAMAVPQTVVALASDIDAWMTKYMAVDSPNMSPFASESFQNYSYNKGSSNSGDGTGSATWQGAFASRLDKYRRLRGLAE